VVKAGDGTPALNYKQFQGYRIPVLKGHGFGRVVVAEADFLCQSCGTPEGVPFQKGLHLL